MRIHYLQHVPFEGPGIIASWAQGNGHKITGTSFFNDEKLPDPEAIEALVIMGGPMGINDEHKYPWLQKEKQFIQRCISLKKKILGICLGAQLVADALGAKVAAMEQKEIGWYPLNWAKEARNHPLFDFLPSRQRVLHWHGDQFQLPAGALKLGYSQGCDNQGFLVDNHIMGLQFHLEMTQEGLAELIHHSRKELVRGPFIQDAETMEQSNHFEENHRSMEQLLHRFFTHKKWT